MSDQRSSLNAEYFAALKGRQQLYGDTPWSTRLFYNGDPSSPVYHPQNSSNGNGPPPRRYTRDQNGWLTPPAPEDPSGKRSSRNRPTTVEYCEKPRSTSLPYNTHVRVRHTPSSTSIVSEDAEMPGFCRRIKNFFQKKSSYYSELTLHGVKDILAAETCCLRIFWVVIVTIAVCLAAYICFLIIRHSTQSLTVTKITYYPPTDGLPYPVITICGNLEGGNYFLDGAKLENVSNGGVYNLLLSGPVWLPDLQEARYAIVQAQTPEALIFRDSLEVRFHTTDPAKLLEHFFFNYGITCSMLMQSCRDANWNKLKCCEIFRPVFNFQHGLCFASDPAKMPSINSSGLFSNFFLKLRTTNITFWKNPVKQGALGVQISLDNGVDQGLWRADDVPLEMGHWGTIKLSIKKITAQTGHANCKQKQDLTLCYFSDYTFSNCMWERRLFLDKRFPIWDKCVLPFAQLTKTGRYYNDLNVTKTSKSLQTNYLTRGTFIGNKPSTPRPCRGVRPIITKWCSLEEILGGVFDYVNKTTSKGGTFVGFWWWISALQMANHNLCDEPCDRIEYLFSVEMQHELGLGNDTAGFALTIPESQYPVIQEVSALEWHDYVALIGGVWGLWVGASILTVIQCIVYTCRSCCKTRLTHRMPRRQRNVKKVLTERHVIKRDERPPSCPPIVGRWCVHY